ncbi:hypothetical protein EVAR_50729_1 [Eumeta japonica]|uniref:Uncharacterized protein n=1 Tax=Eumeta variegata TaxID=151549 RepID=A0A4C1YMA5_EUMVA|nr:hypothetical protein EVAR_50729_1 [Eumeta japonica]
MGYAVCRQKSRDYMKTYSTEESRLCHDAKQIPRNIFGRDRRRAPAQLPIGGGASRYNSISCETFQFSGGAVRDSSLRTSDLFCYEDDD